jgi:hypothetical protein
MKKTKGITKFDLDWQVYRVGLKSYKTYQEKCEKAKSYLMMNLNVADKERVLNYLEGLSMAYRALDRKYILDIKESLHNLDVTDENKFSFDLSKYTEKELKSTANDNFTRCKKFLLKGYRHNELIEFLNKIYSYLDLKEKQKEMKEMIEASYKMKNTHKFFF